MKTLKNPLLRDAIDLLDETEASRIGERIRKIRNERGMSQAELGEQVKLTADRIQKYENGVRKPKNDLLKQIAYALDVSPLALVDPNAGSYTSVMYALFELEEKYNMKIEKGPADKAPSMTLSVSFKDEMYGYLQDWLEVYTRTQNQLELATSEEEQNEILKSYKNWKWNYPKALVDTYDRDREKARIKNKIAMLEAAYDELDS